MAELENETISKFIRSRQQSKCRGNEYKYK